MPRSVFWRAVFELLVTFPLSAYPYTVTNPELPCLIALSPSVCDFSTSLIQRSSLCGNRAWSRTNLIYIDEGEVGVYKEYDFAQPFQR